MIQFSLYSKFKAPPPARVREAEQRVESMERHKGDIQKIYIDDPVLRLEMGYCRKIATAAIILAAISITASIITLLVK